MELFYRFSVVVAIVGTLILSSCTDDVYDPERGIQTEPKENPLGEDFTAPVWGIERSGFFNGREKWAKGFENQRV